MQFEFDPETLIDEVKKRPGLWDHETLEYRSKHYKQDAWEDIVRTLSGSSDISKTEMRELEVQLQKKWKSFRDCYIKILRNPNRQRRPYIYTKQLSFLKPICTRSKPAEPKSEDECSQSEEETKVKKRRRHKVLVKKERRSGDYTTDDETYLDMSGKVSDDTENESGTGNQNHHNQSTSSKKSEHFAFANVEVTQNDSNDCDRLFLLSMLPYLKSIPEQYKLNVKMELMQVIQNAKSFDGDQNVI